MTQEYKTFRTMKSSGLIKKIKNNYDSYIKEGDFNDVDLIGLLGNSFVLGYEKCLDEIIEELNNSYIQNRKDWFFRSFKTLNDYIEYAFYSKQYDINNLSQFENKFYNEKEHNACFSSEDGMFDYYLKVLKELKY